MLITVGIGNTVMKISVFEIQGIDSSNIDDNLQSIAALKTFEISTVTSKSSDEYSLIIYNILKINNIDLSKIEGGIISSVVPNITSVVYMALKNITSSYIYTVESGIKTGLKIGIESTAELGSDLVANAVSATTLYKSPLLVIDYNTATSVTFIDKDKTLVGVSIMSGVMTSINSLSEKTALLGNISLDKYKDKDFIGKNTVDSIKSGVINTFAFSTDGFISKTKNLWNTSDLTVVATGNWSNLIVPNCENKIKQKYDLNSLGLLKIYILNAKKRKSVSTL